MENQNKILKRSQFYQYYLKYFVTKIAISNIYMERIENPTIYINQIMNMYENINAFLKLIERDRMVTPYDAIEIANDINHHEGISKGFRKIQVEIRIADFFPIPPYMVPQAVYSLFDNYNHTWRDLDIYEREAKFHIEFVRIQPFEDGNKRTARLITNYNLFKQNCSPVIIGENETKEYFSYINRYDIEGFSQYLKMKSKEEFQQMLSLYKTLNRQTFDCDLEMVEFEKSKKMIKSIWEDLKK